MENIFKQTSDLSTVEKSTTTVVPITVIGNVPSENLEDTKPLDLEELALAEAVGSPMYYTAQPDDTVYSISMKFNITRDNFRAWNNIGSNNIILAGRQYIVGYDTVIDFDQNKVVMWVNNNTQDNPRLSLGQKVVRLSTRNSAGVMILFWNGKQYEFTNINDNYLKTLPELLNVPQNFNLDVTHIYSRVKSYKGTNPFLDAIIEKVNPTNIKWLASATNQDIFNLSKKFNDKFSINLSDKVATMATYTDAIFQIFNPQINSMTYKDTTLFVPLSEDWFNSKPGLKKYYQNRWLSDGDLWVFNGSSGEGVIDSEPNRFNKVKIELIRLKDELDNLLVRNTPEGAWLTTLNSASFANISRIIFISNNTWHLNNTQRYGDYVALMNTVGLIQSPGLLTILIHEMNANSITLKGTTPVFPVETHINDKETGSVWIQSKNLADFKKQVLGDVVSMDKLYQSSGCINAVILALILSLRNTEIEV